MSERSDSDAIKLIEARRAALPPRKAVQHSVAPIGATIRAMEAEMVFPASKQRPPRPEREIEADKPDWSIWSNAGFPLRHRERMLWQPESYPPEAADKIDSALTAIMRRDTVVLLGPRGTGKTQLATQLSRRWFEETRRTLRYIRAFDMLNQIKRSAYDENKPRPDHDWVSTGLLVIDELHEQRMSEDDALWFGQVFDKRYADVKPTIMVSNLNPSGLATLVGASVWSRMQECARIIVCDWPSFRTRPA